MYIYIMSISWMKYYNTELDVGKSDESVLKDLLTEVGKSINQSIENLTVVMDKFDRRN